MLRISYGLSGLLFCCLVGRANSNTCAVDLSFYDDVNACVADTPKLSACFSSAAAFDDYASCSPDAARLTYHQLGSTWASAGDQFGKLSGVVSWSMIRGSGAADNQIQFYFHSSDVCAPSTGDYQIVVKNAAVKVPDIQAGKCVKVELQIARQAANTFHFVKEVYLKGVRFPDVDVGTNEPGIDVGTTGTDSGSSGLPQAAIIMIAVGAAASGVVAGLLFLSQSRRQLKRVSAKVVKVTPTVHKDVLEPVDEQSVDWSVICEMLKVTDPRNLGYGRDVSSRQEKSIQRSDKYTRLRPVHAWKIRKPEEDIVYSAKQQKMQKDMVELSNVGVISPQVVTKLDNVSRRLHVEESVNEKMLLHGTQPEAILSILHNGLNERLSGGGSFGDGVYLSEDPSKIDQYCTPDAREECPSGSTLPALHETLYKDLTRYEGTVFYCFAVRATLGIPVFTLDGEHSATEQGQKVFATEDHRELTTIPGSLPPTHYHSLIVEVGGKVKRHREFVIFNGDHTRLEYLIAFVRE